MRLGERFEGAGALGGGTCATVGNLFSTEGQRFGRQV